MYFLNFEIKKVHLAGKIRKGLREDECWRTETQEGTQQMQKQRPEVTMQVWGNACNFALEWARKRKMRLERDPEPQGASHSRDYCSHKPAVRKFKLEPCP